MQIIKNNTTYFYTSSKKAGIDWPAAKKKKYTKRPLDIGNRSATHKRQTECFGGAVLDLWWWKK